eukprot:m51a1_g13039 hypothetical protein (130) ;mRNA; f:57-446
MGLQRRSQAGLDWYEAATEALQRYQRESALRDEEERARERQPYLDQLVEELRELEAAAKQGDQELLDHVYLKHPPTDGSTKPTGKGMAKMLLLAIAHYHPDRQIQHDKKWQVLCEVIAKLLSAHYQVYK